MDYREIKFIIDSRLDNLSFIGPVVNKLCSLASLSDIDSYRIELCTVEAVTNSINHAYENRPGNKVEVIFSISSEELVIIVCDNGRKMSEKEQRFLDQENNISLEIQHGDLNNIPERGRGLKIIKSIMDEVRYQSQEDKNCLVMIKKISLLP